MRTRYSATRQKLSEWDPASWGRETDKPRVKISVGSIKPNTHYIWRRVNGPRRRNEWTENESHPNDGETRGSGQSSRGDLGIPCAFTWGLEVWIQALFLSTICALNSGSVCVSPCCCYSLAVCFWGEDSPMFLQKQIQNQKGFCSSDFPLRSWMNVSRQHHNTHFQKALSMCGLHILVQWSFC